MTEQTQQLEAQAKKRENYERPTSATKSVILTHDQFDAVLLIWTVLSLEQLMSMLLHGKEHLMIFSPNILPLAPPLSASNPTITNMLMVSRVMMELVAFLNQEILNCPGVTMMIAGFDTICALGNLKNQIFLKQLQEHHVQPYETTVALIQSLKKAGIKIAVITASENGAEVLKAANLVHVFDAKVDGLDAIRLKLKGKPEPDTF